MYCEIWQNQQLLISISNLTALSTKPSVLHCHLVKWPSLQSHFWQGQVSLVSTLMDMGVYLHLQIAFLKHSYRKKKRRENNIQFNIVVMSSLTFQIQE